MVAPDVERVDAHEAQQRRARGAAILVDVRGEQQYQRGHISGARWLPVREVEERAEELPRDKDIIFY